MITLVIIRSFAIIFEKIRLKIINMREKIKVRRFVI
jgi:hypothetical protein